MCRRRAKRREASSWRDATAAAFFQSPASLLGLRLVENTGEGKLLPPEVLARRQRLWHVDGQRTWLGPKSFWRLRIRGVASVDVGCTCGPIAIVTFTASWAGCTWSAS